MQKLSTQGLDFFLRRTIDVLLASPGSCFINVFSLTGKPLTQADFPLRPLDPEEYKMGNTPEKTAVKKAKEDVDEMFSNEANSTAGKML